MRRNGCKLENMRRVVAHVEKEDWANAGAKCERSESMKRVQQKW